MRLFLMIITKEYHNRYVAYPPKTNKQKMWIWWQIHEVYFLFFFNSWFPVICNQNQQITHKIAQFQVHTVIKNLAKIITHLLSTVPSSSPVCPGKVEKLHEHRTIQNVNNYYNLGTGDSSDLKWQNARPVFLKSAKLGENWSQKSRKCVFDCLPYYWTRYPKKIWLKTARNSPYFLPFLLGQKKNVKKQIIISDNVLLLYLYLSSVLSLFLSRMKYLNPGFELVVKSYLARRTKTLPRLVVARL